MKGIKRIIFLIIMIIIMILIVIMALIKLNNIEDNDINDVNEIEDEYHEHYEEERNTSAHIVENANTFYTIENCINTYLDNVYSRDNTRIQKLLYKPSEISNIEFYDTQKENTAQEIWEANYDDASIYYVFTKIRDKDTFDISNQINYFFTVILDETNRTFAIIPHGQQHLESNLKLIENYTIDSIKKNELNSYEEEIIYNEDIINKYFTEYKKNALYNINDAYGLLDEEYRNSKFENIEAFKLYIDNNRESLLNSTIIQYSKDEFDDYVQYTLIDNYKKYYIIKETSVMKFKVLLDNYTINSEEIDSEYQKASDEVKISTNLDKIFKMIDNKEYKTIYDKYLNIGFKNNYFSDYATFETYMSNTFFEYNYLGNKTLQKQGENYIIKVNYKDGISSAAETRQISIIMRLNDNMNFEIAFEMQ